MTSDIRNTELALIHLARRDLGLADDAYRALVGRISGGRTESSGDLDQAERRALIEHFRRSGFGKAAGRSPARGQDARAQAGKLRALWYSLHALGVVRSTDDLALASFVCRHTGIQVMRWNRVEDLGRATECLKGWCARVGYEPKPSTMEGECKGRFEPALILAQWDRLVRLDAFRHGELARLDTWLHGQGFHVAHPGFLPLDDAKEVIRRLGKWLRRLAAQSAESGDG